ncbi:ATP-binding protein [Desulfurivibrio dismutans]|uniref:ATP-binding protein n=1 Tax=Desulfurivibrio dismutans TaxID=1398908 RepID=UPI0023DB4452|nr:4Fe-4S dicluster domain-containing protein [Desulfurivibrio alkaliphilus]MDF1615405.1 4Fe-4S ferredoxin [Desulfurivibrio alkaliphilus]
MKVTRKIIEIDENLCDGCGQCVPDCAEGALEIIDGKARLVAEKYCDGLGACLGACPTGALKVIERQADDFDEAAVEELLAAKKVQAEAPAPAAADTMACGCASSHIQSFGPATSPCQAANQPRSTAGAPAVPAAYAGADPAQSALTHWPIQIRLVPPEAPFLKGADLLVAADCVPVAHPAFNRELLPGKTVLLGCPKFDDAESYVAKFSEIFQVAGIKSITMAIMEVPCCGSMRGIIQAAQQRAGTSIPVEEVVIGVRGNRL